jgi:hypothetical protein
VCYHLLQGFDDLLRHDPFDRQSLVRGVVRGNPVYLKGIDDGGYSELEQRIDVDQSVA